MPSDVTWCCYWYCISFGTKRARNIQNGQRCSSLQCSCSWKESNRTGSWLPYRRHYGRTQLLQPHDSCSNDPRQLFANDEVQLAAASLLLLPHAPSSLRTLIRPRTVTTPFLLNTVSPEVNLLRCQRPPGNISAAATVAKGRVRRFWSRVKSNECADPCCTTRQLSMIEYLQTVTGPLRISLTFGSPRLLTENLMGKSRKWMNPSLFWDVMRCRLLVAYWRFGTTCRIAHVYGNSRVSIITLPSQTPTGPGTSLKQYLGSAGLDSRPHAGPYERYFRDFTQGLHKKPLHTSN